MEELVDSPERKALIAAGRLGGAIHLPWKHPERQAAMNEYFRLRKQLKASKPKARRKTKSKPLELSQTELMAKRVANDLKQVADTLPTGDESRINMLSDRLDIVNEFKLK